MAVSDAHKKASYKYNSARDNIMIRPDKSTGAAIRAAAAAAGLSVQQYILSALSAFGTFDASGAGDRAGAGPGDPEN
jgi:predicted DNA binding CopG/RHH family protein